MTNLRMKPFDTGESEDPAPTIITYTDTSAYVPVTMMPDETVADIAKRVYGVNSELNRDKIRANNPHPKPGDKFHVIAPVHT